MTAHVAKWKHSEVDELASLLTSKKIIGIVDVAGIPAPQLQKMRANLRAKAQIRCAKNTLIQKALEQADAKVKGIAALKPEINGQAAILSTDLNPFSLFREIKATRTKAPAKGGETAPADIVVKAGDTPFKPGPIVGELQKVGIPAAIQEGKVIIKSDKVVVSAGNKIPVGVAQMLSRLEIFPLEIGLKLQVVYEEGFIFKPQVLDIDIDKFKATLAQASANAFLLALEQAWVAKTTITPLIQKAHRHAFILALERNIYTKDTMPLLLSKAHRSMMSIATKAPDALDDELKKKVT